MGQAERRRTDCINILLHLLPCETEETRENRITDL